MSLVPVIATIKGEDVVGMIVAAAIAVYLIYVLVKAERL